MTARKQNGVSMILALFLVVTLAAMGGYLLSIYTAQQLTTTQDELAQRAYQAARSGLEWGAYQLIRQSGGTFTTNCNGGSTTQTLTFTAASGNLSGFSARVTCTAFLPTQAEAGMTVRSYRIVSRGCNQADCASPTLGPLYVEREIQATVAN